MPNVSQPKALIYCRTACADQKGNSLNSQEVRCREYARNQGYEVLKVFHDSGVSGNETDRPGFQDMLAFLNMLKDGETNIIIDGISRLSRNLSTHIQLRNTIESSSGKLECPSFKFGGEPVDQLLETILVSAEQHIDRR